MKLVGFFGLDARSVLRQPQRQELLHDYSTNSPGWRVVRARTGALEGGHSGASRICLRTLADYPSGTATIWP